MNSISLRATALFSSLALGACSFGMRDPHPPMHNPHPEVPPPMPVAYVPPPATAEGDDWNKIIDSLKRDQLVQDQQKEALADEHYQLAERYFQAARFEQADLEVNQSLKLDPNHLGARALWEDVQVALGKGVVTPQHKQIQQALDLERARRQQTLIEMGDAYNRGLRAFNEADYGAAEAEFRTIIEYIKWLPYDLALEEYRTMALKMLDQTRGAARVAEIAAEELRRKRVELEKQGQDYQRALTEREEVEVLFNQAQKYFEEQRYDEALKLTERILNLNPNLKTVREMRTVTQRLRHQKVEADGLKSYVEEWKRTFENVDMLSVVHPDLFSYPDPELWRKTAERGPKRIGGQDEDVLSDEDQAIMNLLKTQPISMDSPQIPLSEFKDQLQAYTGLNFAFSQIEDTEVSVNAQLTGVTVENLLNIALAPVDIGWLVENGVVLIVPTSVVLAQTRLEVYDVQDITYALQDFPGVDISLSSNQIGVNTQTDEGEAVEFTTDQLVELIQGTIDSEGWDAPGRSIQPHQGLLIIRTIPAVHASVARLLRDFRASTGLLVNVESRFLTVHDDFLEQVGMDFRDVDQIPIAFPAFPRQPIGLLNADDINPAFNVPTRFFDPDGGGALTNTSAGIVGTNGSNVTRPYGIRVQNVMMADQVVQRFLQEVWGTAGGLSLQYLLVDDVSVSAILRMVEKTSRGHILNAPKLTLFNTQRGNTLISNQLAYVRDFNVQIGGAQVVPDPEIGVVNDGISMDVRPIVSPDRRFITLEMRPTVAILTPTPPSIATIQTVIGGTAVGAPPGRVLDIETPEIEVQRIRTTVVVPDRGTMIIGGLTIFFDVDEKSEVPLWRNLPIIGFLGSERFQGRQRNQLLILVRAEIIIPDEKEQEAF